MKPTFIKCSRFGLFFLLVVSFFACKDKNANQIPTSKAVKGIFYIDLYEEGELEAVNAINISSPSISWRFATNMKITFLVKDGTEVNAGDTVIVFDPSDVNKAIIDAQSKLEISGAELEKMIAQQESDLEELRANFEVTRISHEISKINFEKAEYESEMMRKQIQLNLEKAEIALDQAKEQIDNRIKINTEEIKQKKLTITQDETRLNEAYDALRQLTVITPSPGIAIIARNWSSGNKFQVGEQTWTGMPLISLPDLSLLKANVKINEVDIAKISSGLDVEIKPDAFSENKFTGVVKDVANLAVNKQGSTKIKVFPVAIYLNETHKDLLPGLTVSCRIIIDKLEDVLYVPIDAINTEEGINVVYKKTASGFKKIEVETGRSNADFTIIEKGLDEGDEVALTNPFSEAKKDKEASVSFVVSLLLAVALLFTSCGKMGDKEANKEKNAGGTTIIETGTLEAINNKLFILPRYSMYWWEMRITGMVENGTMVNEGDSIIQVDASEVNKLIIERETNLETERANLEKLQVSQSNQISDLESKIRNETAAFNLKKIELESSRFETERHQAIKQLEFKQAELNLAKEKRKLELAKIVNENDAKIQHIRIRQLEDDLKNFYSILPSLTVRSTVTGVFQRGRNLRTGQTLNTGDMAITGYSMGNVPELKWMKVETFINENDFLKLQVGQKVNVRLDATPEIIFNGEVAYVGKLCHLKEQNSKQKGFDVEVKMLEPDERLKPGMTVSCEFLPN